MKIEEARVSALARAVVEAQYDDDWCAFCQEHAGVGDAHEVGCPVLIAENWLKSRKKPKNEVRIFRELQCAHRLRIPVKLTIGDGVEIYAVVDEVQFVRRAGDDKFSLADAGVTISLLPDDEYPVTRANLPAL